MSFHSHLLSISELKQKEIFTTATENRFTQNDSIIINSSLYNDTMSLIFLYVKTFETIDSFA